MSLNDFDAVDVFDANYLIAILEREGWRDARIVRACQLIVDLDKQLDTYNGNTRTQTALRPV